MGNKVDRDKVRALTLTHTLYMTVVQHTVII